jgi:major membrane immunogen (membrane-anchored lipoprotein)
MKKNYASLMIVFVIVIAMITTTAETSAKQFKDGVYKGESRSKYTHEPYWGQVRLKIKDDKVTWLKFRIIDKEKNEIFGPKYERYFKYTPRYIMQCHEELKGIEIYTEAFSKSKDIEQVDAITGATWSHDLLKSTFYVTLEKARNK